MPLYEYECDACAHRFEVIQKFSDPPIELCPTCGGTVRKLLSSPAIQFRGSGWYITDYARKDQKDKEDRKNRKDQAEKGPDAKPADATPAVASASSSDISSSSSSSKSASSGSASTKDS